MPATILSDNGASSGTAGLKTSGSNDGILELQTTTGGGTATAAITIDTAQRSKFPTTIGVGGATPATSGSGISFPATASASSDANTLDDYEEGTWTPTYTTDGTNFTSVTYTQTSGAYTKIGDRVFVLGSLRTNAITVGSASGNVLIGGFPFTVGADPRGSVYLGYSAGFAGDEPLSAVFQPATTTAYLYYKTAVNGDSLTLQVSDMGTGATSNYILFSGFYTV
jgi:hypothetical protein